MARALASDPKVLVLITPTAGVDVRSKEALLEAVGQARARGTPASSSSPTTSTSFARATGIFVMFRGRIVRMIERGWQDRDLVAAMEGVSDV